MSETVLQRCIRKSLARYCGDRVKVLRHNAGQFRRGSRVIHGVEAGTPDLQVLLPAPALTLWIETKTEEGKLRPSQLSWHAWARAKGHTVIVARKVSTAVNAVREALAQ